MRILAAIVAFIASSAVAWAADTSKDNYYHLCNDADLIGGTWKLMVLRETPKRKESSMYKHLRYQYLSFYPGGLYSFVITNREIIKPVELEKAMEWPQQQKRTLRYALDGQGVLNLYSDKKINYSYRCLAITKDKGEYKKGDLVVTGYTRKARTKLYKLYRRWF